MTTIFTKNVRKHYLHACDFFHVCRVLQCAVKGHIMEPYNIPTFYRLPILTLNHSFFNPFKCLVTLFLLL